MDMKDTIRGYIVKELMNQPKYKLGDNDSIIKGGLVDSFSLVQLGLFLEETFGVHADDTDLNADLMDSVQMIADYVESHR
jgi:acyl carrier protein